MKGQEKAFWRKWRCQREAGLVEKGLSRLEAQREARDEARRRRTFVSQVGLEAAAFAPVRVISRGKTFTIRQFAFDSALMPEDKAKTHLPWLAEQERDATPH